MVSDSCYAGRLVRGAPVSLEAARRQADREAYLAKEQSKASRQLFSSGGNEPVSDGGGDGKHSVFATAFLNSLREMSFERFSVADLFGPVSAGLAHSQQSPEINPLPNSGHDGGSFIFERTNTAPSQLPSSESSGPPEAGNSGVRTIVAGWGCDAAPIRAQLTQQPGNEGLLLQFAQCAYEEGSFADSIGAWNQLIKLNDGNASYYEGRGLAKLKSDAIDGAQKDFVTATQKDARNGQYWADLAQADEQLNNWQETARCYYKAIQLGAKTKENYLGLAGAYDKTGNRDLANEARGVAEKMK